MSLNRGFLATLLRDCPAFGIYFASYEYMSRKMSKDGKMESLTGPQLLLAGGGAGMLSWLFNYPTDVIKTRFQTTYYPSYMDCIRSTYAEGGYRVFFTGLGSTLLRAFPSNAATFFTVEWTYRLLLDFNVLGVGTPAEHRLQLHKRHLSMSDFWHTNCLLMLPEAGSTSIDPMIHGCRGAGMLSWLFNYPTDVIKTRFQTTYYPSYMDCIRSTYAEGGYRVFFTGLGSTLLRAFPSNAATFFTVEWTYRLLLDFNVLGVGTPAEHRLQLHKRHLSMSDFWHTNCLLMLPEAGSTSIDPMIHGCRFL
ncbi:carnitine/acylcarnitine carrier protein CACL domain protein [Ostertagia ostertagi]